MSVSATYATLVNGAHPLTMQMQAQAHPIEEAGPCCGLRYSTSDLTCRQEMDGDNPACYRLSLKTRSSKSHKQCLALVKFYADIQDIDPAQASVEDAWKYYCMVGHSQLSAILLEFMCANFDCLRTERPEFFLAVSLGDFESLVGNEILRTSRGWKEVFRLSLIADWAMHKSMQPGGGLRVGDTVQVNPECEVEHWRGALCKVVKIDGACVRIQRVSALNGEDASRVGISSVGSGLSAASRVEVQSVGVSERVSSADGQVVVVMDMLEITAEQLYDAGQIAMIQLSKHVRQASIPVSDFGEHLSIEQLCYVSKLPSIMCWINVAIADSLQVANKERVYAEKGILAAHFRSSRMYGNEEQNQARLQLAIAGQQKTNETICKLLTVILKKSAERIDSRNELATQQIRQLTAELNRQQHLNQQQQETHRQHNHALLDHLVAQRVDSFPLEQLEALVAQRRATAAQGAGTHRVSEIATAVGAAACSSSDHEVEGVNVSKRANERVAEGTMDPKRPRLE
jgi:hypothetical protein